MIVSLAIAFTYLIFGAEEARTRFPWLNPAYFMGAGMLTVMTGSLLPPLLGLPAPLGAGQTGAAFFAPVDFGALLGLPLPEGFFISTSWMFELAICLAVMGSCAYLIQTFTGRDAHFEKVEQSTWKS